MNREFGVEAKLLGDMSIPARDQPRVPLRPRARGGSGVSASGDIPRLDAANRIVRVLEVLVMVSQWDVCIARVNDCKGVRRNGLKCTKRVHLQIDLLRWRVDILGGDGPT